MAVTSPTYRLSDAQRLSHKGAAMRRMSHEDASVSQ